MNHVGASKDSVRYNVHFKERTLTTLNSSDFELNTAKLLMFIERLSESIIYGKF